MLRWMKKKYDKDGKIQLKAWNSMKNLRFDKIERSEDKE